MPASNIDVMKQIFPNKAIHNGSVVMTTDKLGNSTIIVQDDVKYNHTPIPSGVEKRLTDRFQKWTDGF